MVRDRLSLVLLVAALVGSAGAGQRARVLDSTVRNCDAAGMPWEGGKSGDGVYQRIISLMPWHPVYVEPFLGGGAIMRLKRPARLSIGIDRDRAAVLELASAFWPVPGPRAGLGSGDGARRRRSANLPVADPLAFSIEGARGAFRFLEGDGIEFLRFYPWAGDELVYADPPYLRSTCKSRCRYKFDLADVDHLRLLRVVMALPCKVLLSGYWSELYADTLKGWHTLSFQAPTRRGMATEWLWANYPLPPAELHDYRYIGANYRERERIRNLIKRRLNGIRRLPALERRALLVAIQETDFEILKVGAV
jgi:DNA adenine methylase